jgi:hypothetical protein
VRLLLPREWQEIFPAYITRRAAISKSILDRVLSRSGSKLNLTAEVKALRETITANFAEREFLYYSRQATNAVHPAASFLSKPNHSNVQEMGRSFFGTFDDPDRYSGSFPSLKLLQSIIDKILAHRRPYHDRFMRTIGPG